jgi:ribosomal-protein-alanine N-acetyltransferase
MTQQAALPIPAGLTLETPRCVLRHPRDADGPRLLSAFRSPAFPRDLPLAQLRTAEQVQGWIDGCRARWAAGQGYTWTVEHKSDGTLVGQVTLASTVRAGTWALAFWTHPDCWGQGYATETARRAIEFAFDGLAAARVWAAAATWNTGSLRVLEKLGMTYLVDNPAGYTIDDRPIATQEYEITSAGFASTVPM